MCASSMPPKQWFCNCEKHCKGRTKEVSRSTYQRHAPFRKPAFLDGSGSGHCLPITQYFAPARPKRAEPGLPDSHRTNNTLRAQAAQVATASGSASLPVSRVSTPVRKDAMIHLIPIHWAHRNVVGAGNHNSCQHWHRLGEYYEF
jgi:hypothetical protein